MESSIFESQEYVQAIYNASSRADRRRMLFGNKNRLMTKKGYRNGRKIQRKRV